jgi:4'-phosphopantetheinyl transferase EntD
MFTLLHILASTTNKAFTTQFLSKQLSGAYIAIVHLPDTSKNELTTSIITDLQCQHVHKNMNIILPEEIDYIYTKTGGMSMKRINQFIGGRKALRDVVSREYVDVQIPPIFNDDYGAPSIPSELNILCSISHKKEFAVAAVKQVQLGCSHSKLGTVCCYDITF